MQTAPTLLVLTDFFPAAGYALDYATSLAGPLGARLVLLHVRRDSVLDAEAFTSELTNLNASAIKLALNCLTRDLPVPVVAEVGYGRLLPAITDAVRRHQPLLLVLGRPADEELPDELTSTTALEILQHAPYPMLVVPPVPASATPRRLLLAVDGEPFTLDDYAGSTRQLLNALHAELTVIQCVTRQQVDDGAALHSVQQTGLTVELGVPQFRQVVAPDAATGILTAAQPADYDAVVLLARRRSVFGRLFHRSVTAQVLLHSKLPVLVLPAQ